MRITSDTVISNGGYVPDGCMIAFTGEIINLLEPSGNAYDTIDIAHGLAHTCRWNGATKSYYSVAEHSVRMFDRFYAQGRLAEAKTALFHDCEEAYWGDIVKPLKRMLPADMRNAMETMRQQIFETFAIEPLTDATHDADRAEIVWDFENLILSGKHTGWLPEQARREFLDRCSRLTV